MRVLIVTSGSTGDVAPYTGLGARLRDAGHAVTLATHAPFRDQVETSGLAFTPLPGDLRDVLPHAPGATSSGTNPRALLRLASLARPLVASLPAGVTKAVEEVRPDAVLLSTLVAPLGFQVADAYGIRRAAVFLQPIHPTREFAPVLTGARSFGPWADRALGHLTTRAVEALYAAPIRDLRRTLGLPRVPLARLRADQEWREPTFHGFSPAVVPRPADWPPQLRVTGYWWPVAGPGWQPPGALTAFLAAGEKPVFAGFGSMAPGHGARLATTVVAAARRAGVRVLLQAGWSGLAATGGDDVLSIGPVPHDWLFPRMAAVVHHAGAGTTAAGLRAGVPAVPVPVLADQPFWAARLHRLGAATRPIPMARLTTRNLAAALTVAPRHTPAARALAARLFTEDGAAPIIQWLRA